VHACISTINRKQKNPDGNLRASLLKTDMTAFRAASGCFPIENEARTRSIDPVADHRPG
jgi:hypothetical protein